MAYPHIGHWLPPAVADREAAHSNNRSREKKDKGRPCFEAGEGGNQWRKKARGGASPDATAWGPRAPVYFLCPIEYTRWLVGGF